MATWGRQMGDVAIRALLHRISTVVSVHVVVLLTEACLSVETMHAQLHHLATERAAAKRGLGVMRADAALLQRRLAQHRAEAAHWQARAEMALRAGDASLARRALARKLQEQHVAGQYADAYTAQQRSLAQVHAAIEQLEAHIGEMRSMHAQGRHIHTDHAAPRQAYAALSRLDDEMVDARFAQLELDHAMNDLRRTVHNT